MPHQCTGCGHTFEDGSKEMLSGCPECGGNKFQFRPAGGPAGRSTDGTDASPEGDGDTVSGDPDPNDADRPTGPDRPEPDTSSVAETVGRATTRVRDFVSSNSTPSDPESASEWPDEWESSTDLPSDETSGPPDPSLSGGDPDRTRPDSGELPANEDEDEDEDEDDIIDADARRAASERSEGPKEDTAQASARTDVVSPEELDESAPVSPEEPDDGIPADDRSLASDTDDSSATDDSSSEPDRSPPASPAAPDSTRDGEVVSEPTGEDPDLSELRAQLNDQFESIKILEPGQYELNLMELYDREEYIIALQENGRYVIQVPEQWIGEDAADR